MTTVSASPWNAQGEQKRAAVRAMFAEIANRYDFMNGLMSLSLHRRWRRAAVAELRLAPGSVALDVCCGTGDFFAPLREKVDASGRVFGLDFCLPMLERATAKPGGDGLGLADACRLPIRAGSVDAVTVGWGIRNVPDVDGAHREIVRVLRKGGRFVSVDMALPRNRVVRALSRFVGQTLLPRLGALFGMRTAYTYLPESTERFASREALAESMRRAGLVDVHFRDLFFGNICLHAGSKP
ncbi:MAG: ubiquinone/menaquinone biosynthesis methyltransferase [Fimbriimonadaceae bacterium]|nr:ubiquinone/menaquinone biosynthesis methyltransferase [Fimbriimonadaceae bacterium]